MHAVDPYQLVEVLPRRVQLVKRVNHRLRQLGIHREAFPRPIHRRTGQPQLLEDMAPLSLLPFPDLFDELFAAQVVARDLLVLEELLLDDNLRGDTSVVRARDPEGIAALCTNKTCSGNDLYG